MGGEWQLQRVPVEQRVEALPEVPEVWWVERRQQVAGRVASSGGTAGRVPLRPRHGSGGGYCGLLGAGRGGVAAHGGRRYKRNAGPRRVFPAPP